MSLVSLDPCRSNDTVHSHIYDLADSAIFFMTLYRVIAYNSQLKGGARSLINLILRDGNL